MTVETLVYNITEWLRKQVKAARMDGLIVGLSGGLDSAVVSYLIKQAYPNNSLAVMMPLRSNPVDMQHARKVVEACGINHTTIDLTDTHQLMYQTIVKKSKWHEETDRIADANLRARLRMSTLYTLATNYRYLVVGTDNAAEWYTGYFTKYGDGGVDLQPIIELTKGEVAEMAAYLQVPQEIIDKKPSADLWVGQTDEEEMGTTYPMIDQYIKGLDVPEKDRLLIEKMHKKTEHKRQLATQYKFKKDNFLVN